jgi:bifunctional lysine-specific demethylase and histidyl-hydroxylase MINA
MAIMNPNCFLKTFPHEEGNVYVSQDLTGFRDIFRLLTGNRIDAFFNDFWEKNPVHFQSHGNSHKLINSNVFSRKKLMEIIENNQLLLDTNLSAVKYTGNLRQSWAFDSEVANTQEVIKAFKKLQTVQFFQPQRFSDDLHRINAGFEFIFGSLAGASAYLTPANSQGLAPHHDDVDVFVLQVCLCHILHFCSRQNKN